MPTSAERCLGSTIKQTNKKFCATRSVTLRLPPELKTMPLAPTPAEPHSIPRLKWRPHWELGRMLELKESSEKQRGFIDHHFCKWPLVILANGRAAIF